MRINEMRMSNGTTCLVIDAYSNSRSRSSAVLSVCLTLLVSSVCAVGVLPVTFIPRLFSGSDYPQPVALNHTVEATSMINHGVHNAQRGQDGAYSN